MLLWGYTDNGWRKNGYSGIYRFHSHIPISEAPNEFYWAFKEAVDKLATTARQELPVSRLTGQSSHVFHGHRAGCKINGRIENNNLYKILKEAINGTCLKWYLIEKYDWSESSFQSVAWSIHQRETQKIIRQKRVTLVKYNHGWLATNKRRSREGTSCPPQGVEENSRKFP